MELAKKEEYLKKLLKNTWQIKKTML
jgi:hypothetical protein